MTEQKDKVCWLKQGVNIKLLALKLEEKEEREDLETEGEGVGRNFKIEREPRSVEEERGEIKRLEGRRRGQEREREGRDQVDRKKEAGKIFRTVVKIPSP